MGLISGCRYPKANLKAKIIYMLTLLSKGVPTNCLKFFCLKFFSYATGPVVNLELRISPRIFKKIRNGPNGILWGLGGNWFMKKTRSKKSHDTVPLSGWESERAEECLRWRSSWSRTLICCCPRCCIRTPTECPPPLFYRQYLTTKTLWDTFRFRI